MDLPSRRLTIREALLAWCALALLAALVFAPHVAHGGFYLDDWADAAGFRYPSPAGQTLGNELDYFWGIFGYRPVLVLYTPLKYFVFGTHMGLIIAWTVFLGVVVAALMYGVMRTLGVPWFHAWAIAALTVVYPWFDAIRLWGSANPPPLSIALALGGFWIALWALRRHSWRAHLLAAAFYLVSILTYEVTLPLIACFGVVYVWRVGWRKGRVRWAIDLLVVAIGVVWDRTQTTREVSGASAWLRHLREIVDGGGQIVARTLQPLGPDPRTGAVLALLALVLVAGLGLWLRRERRERPGWGLREWLLLAGGGLAVAVLGWTVFLPANPYYTPTVLGEINRVNALAGLGLVVAAYGALGVAAAAAARLIRHPGWAAPATVALACLLGAAYVHVLERHIRIWDDASRAQTAALRLIQRTYPRLPPGATVFTAGLRGHSTYGVPIFAVAWDLDGALRLRYGDPGVSGFPVIDGQELACEARGVALVGGEATVAESPYGSARLLNLGTGAHARPADRRACERALHAYPPGPLFLTSAY